MAKAKPRQNMVRTMVFLRPDQLQRLKLAQEETGARLAEIVRRAVDKYFDSTPKRGRR
jgi:myo-inositol catabolism protein IolC